MSHSSQENTVLPSINTNFAYAPQQQQHQSFSSSPQTLTNGNGHGHGIDENFQGNDYNHGQDQACDDDGTVHPSNNLPDILQKSLVQKSNKSFLSLLPQSYPPIALPSIPSLDAVSTGLSQSYSDTSDHYGGQRIHSAGGVWHPTHPQSYLHLNGQMHSAPPTADNSFQAFQVQSRFHHAAIPPVTAPLTLPHEYAAFHPESPFQVMHASESGPLQHQQSRGPTHHPTDGQSTAPIFPLQTHQPYLVHMPTSTPYQLPSIRPTLHFSHSFSGAHGDAMYSPAAMDVNQQPYYFPQSDAKSEPEGVLASGMGHSQQLGSVTEQQKQTNMSQSLVIDPSMSAVTPQMMYPAVYQSAGLSTATSQEYDGQGAMHLQTGMTTNGMSAPYRHEEITDVDHQNGESSRSGPASRSEKETPSRSVRPRGKPGPKPKISGSAKNKEYADVEDNHPEAADEDRPKKKSKKRPAADESEEATGVKANGKGNQFILTLYGMVESTSSYPLIGWNLPGTSIVIPDSKAFSTSLLNQYFRHSTISSFARQLVSYGFQKTELPAREKAMFNNSIRTESKHWTFTHNFFLRGRADLLDRVVPQTSSDRQQKPPPKRSPAAIKREDEAFIEVLKRENMQWRDRCTRMEHAMMEEKARAYQYYALLVERGVIPREIPVMRTPKRDTQLLTAVPAVAAQPQESSRTPYTDCQAQKEPSEDVLLEIDEVRKHESRSPASKVQ
ncbi:hypothetical protein QFC24_002520 [Naganishia onofrii]|uniref:Uncharacterized protein n=1 Tax=Naganishia onofrii TaxID=1851511 RepID=A0ACC2XQ04_9TREE|nr:hypothetical protein QFC24_002520 [Naganishia onofrii]